MCSTTKIKSIKKIGIKQTYDVKVYPNHNFFLSNGLLVHNSGKSVMAQQIAKFLDPSLTLDRICMTGEDFLRKIDIAEKGQAVIMDEAYKDLDSAQSQKRMQGVLKHAMAEMGQKNLFVIVVLPSFFELSKYVAIHRSVALVHVYTGKNLERGYFTFFGKKKKQRMYIRGKKYMAYCEKADFWGRFAGKYVVDEVAYRKKKLEALKLFSQEFQAEDIEYLGKEKYLKWIGRCARLFRDFGMTSDEIYKEVLHASGDDAKEIRKGVELSEQQELSEAGDLIGYKKLVDQLKIKFQLKKKVICIKCGRRIEEPKCPTCFKISRTPVYPTMDDTINVKLKEKIPLTEQELNRVLENKPKKDRITDSITVRPTDDMKEYQRQRRMLIKAKKYLEDLNKGKQKKKEEKVRKELGLPPKELPSNLKMGGAEPKPIDEEEEEQVAQDLLSDTGYDNADERAPAGASDGEPAGEPEEEYQEEKEEDEEHGDIS